MKDIIRKITAVLTAVCLIPLAACSEKEESSSTSEGSVSNTASDGTQLTTTEDEADLGEYVFSENGVKLYYNEEEYSAELMAELEKYFTSYANRDYDAYVECISPEYKEAMEKFLDENHGYDLKTSFESQCDNLEANAGGEFKITRIKAELPAEDGIESFFTDLDGVFETNFYETVTANYETFHDMIFYIMAESNGEEVLLISEFEIVFAEKDGKYYTFG